MILETKIFCCVSFCFTYFVFFNALLLCKDLDYVLSIINVIPNSQVCDFMLE
jgi:hypothetical protein